MDENGGEKGCERPTNLNDLPADILVRILSLLPTTLDAVRTCLISRKWQKMWLYLSVLKFFISEYPKKVSDAETLSSFCMFVVGTLCRRETLPPLDQFCLEVEYKEEWHSVTPLLDLSINFALECNVHDLYIDCCRLRVKEKILDQNEENQLIEYDPDDLPWYTFEFHRLRDAKVKTLELTDCAVDFPVELVRDGTQFSSLRKMTLRRVSLSDDMLSAILIGLVNLEDLIITDWLFVELHEEEDLNIRSSKLRRLELKHFDFGLNSIKISAPNLALLVITLIEADDFILEDVSSLVEACITCIYYDSWSRILSQLSNVECLLTQNCWYEFLLLKELSFSVPETFMFNNLKKLKLRTGYSNSEVIGLVALLERCPNLQHLSLSTLSEWYEEDDIPEELLRKPIKLSLPFVKEVAMGCRYGTPEESEIVNLLEEQGIPVTDDLSVCKNEKLLACYNTNKDWRERIRLGNLSCDTKRIYF